MNRMRRSVVTAAHMLGALILLVGIPAGLIWWIGYPLPRHLSATAWQAWLDDPLTRTFLVNAVGCLLWLVWLFVAYTVGAVLVTAVTRLRLPVPRLAVPLRTAIATAFGVSIVATNTAVPVTAAAVIVAPVTPGAHDHAPAADAGRSGSATNSSVSSEIAAPRFAAAGYDGVLTVRAGDTHYTVTVKRRDTLWHIAASWLGDPYRWPEIYHLNQHHYDQHGRMHHGNLIMPGWVLILPADATPPPGAKPTTPPPVPVPATPHHPGPASPAPPSATSTPEPGGEPGVPAVSPPSAPALVSTAPSPTPTVPASSASSSSPEPTTNDSPPPHAAGHGVDLGERGWITADVGTAVLAAAALVWIQRRRRYRPGRINPHRTDTDLAPLPVTIAAVQHARTPAEDDHMDSLPTEAVDPATVTTATLGSTTDDITLHLDDVPARGLGLTGPGATAASRGVLTAALTAGGPWSPDAEATLLTTRDDLRDILPEGDLPLLDRLEVAETLDNALNTLERHLLRRARYAADDADLTTDPDDDPVPGQAPLVFYAGVPDGPSATRLAAIVAIGARLGITAILTGPWPHGDTWHVSIDGTTTHDGEAGPRLNVLDPTATLDILATIRQARPDTDDDPTSTTEPAHRDQPEPAPHTAAAVPPSGGIGNPSPGIDTEAIDPGADSATGRRLRLSVLGRVTIEAVNGDSRTELHIRRRDGRQILVYLAVNPHGATSDELMAALWPETRPRYSRHRFHTTMSELRQYLDETIASEAISRIDDRYRLNSSVVDVDLWQLTAAIEAAATALDPAAHNAGLREVIRLYRGTLADGHSWLWLIPHQEALRRHILDTHTTLAAAAADPQSALTHIQDAIRLDPYNEDVYRRAMILHAKLDNLDGVRRTLRALATRLTDLEIQVSPQTQQVANDLISRLNARRRATGEST